MRGPGWWAWRGGCRGCYGCDRCGRGTWCCGRGVRWTWRRGRGRWLRPCCRSYQRRRWHVRLRQCARHRGASRLRRGGRRHSDRRRATGLRLRLHDSRCSRDRSGHQQGTKQRPARAVHTSDVLDTGRVVAMHVAVPSTPMRPALQIAHSIHLTAKFVRLAVDARGRAETLPPAGLDRPFWCRRRV